MKARFSLANVLGSEGPGLAAAMRAGLDFLDTQGPAKLLRQVGRSVEGLPPFQPIDKALLQDSFGGNQRGPSDDFLVGRGLFYISEQRKLFLDGTSGHYQMTWGYNHPDLCGAVEEAARAGIVWDNHSNIPQAPLKQLARQLVALANAPGEEDPLDTVLLGVCTGSVACAAALKIQLKVFERDQGRATVPVLMVLEGNYHGTDMVPQSLRGLWPDLLRHVEVAVLPPNDAEELEKAFRQYGSRVAGFWVEPVMMNREAIALSPTYLQLAQRCCRETGALFCVDEIQTGFWQPEIFAYRALNLQPDLVVLGKGMTAGFHPLSGVLFRQRHDVLAQYDAISTNGSASLPAYVALCSLGLIREQAQRIGRVGRAVHQGFQGLVAEFPDQVQSAPGRGHLTGLKFHRVDQALTFHRRLLEEGLWTRVHAYHEGHSTVLTKLGLLADQTVVEFVLGRCRKALESMAQE